METSVLVDGIDPALPFKYIGGDPSLDFVNTVDWTDAGLVDERLLSYDGLTHWAEGAGVVSPRYAATLRQRAATDPATADAVLAEAKRLRALLHTVVSGIAQNAIDAQALAELDEAVVSARGRLRLAARDGGEGAPALGWRWEGGRETLDGLLWPVLRAAADLLTSEPRGRIRVCGGPRCGWVFADRSRNGLRRWCQPDVCGAQAKARRYYARKRDAARDGGQTPGSDPGV